MKVYILKADANNFQNLDMVNENDWEWSQKIDGSHLASYWKPLAVHVLYDEDLDKYLPASDFPLLAFHIPIFSKRAAFTLGDMLAGHGELLPLLCREGEYYAYNVTCVLDALDEDGSNLVRFPDGRILDIKSYSFYPDKLGNCPIFKLPQTPLMDVFVTDEFKHKVEESKLTGFTFKLVYNTD